MITSSSELRNANSEAVTTETEICGSSTNKNACNRVDPRLSAALFLREIEIGWWGPQNDIGHRRRHQGVTQ